MTQKYLVFGLGLILLSSCLLEPDKIVDENPVQNAELIGLVSMQDFIIADGSGAFVLAAFANKNNRRFLASPMRFAVDGKEDLMPRFGFLGQNLPRAVSCDIFTQETLPEKNQRGLVSVGKFQIGPAFQSSLETVPEVQNHPQLVDHTYYLPLTGEMPTGKYQIRVAGNDRVPPFGGTYLSVPEALYEVKINGVGFEKGNHKIKKNEKLVLSWKTPVMPNDDNIMGFSMKIKGKTKTNKLSCFAYEKDFYSADRSELEWVIPAKTLANDLLVAKLDSELSFYRGHFLALEGQISINFEGVRSWETDGELEN